MKVLKQSNYRVIDIGMLPLIYDCREVKNPLIDITDHIIIQPLFLVTRDVGYSYTQTFIDYLFREIVLVTVTKKVLLSYKSEAIYITVTDRSHDRRFIFIVSSVYKDTLDVNAWYDTLQYEKDKNIRYKLTKI